jgi:hypothetical protein
VNKEILQQLETNSLFALLKNWQEEKKEGKDSTMACGGIQE